MPKPITVPLTHPIEHMGQTYTELVFTLEMLMKDIFAIDAASGICLRLGLV